MTPTPSGTFVVVLWLSAWVVGAAWTPAAIANAEPSLRAVLSRVERYVEEYEAALSTLVARERYVQTVPASSRQGVQTRTLVSDFLFFRSPGRDAPWLGFRDVLDVDGAPIEHQGERLRDIVRSPADAESQAMSMARENARYNIGRFVRTVNVPICVVAWMHPRMRDRFSFKHVGNDRIDDVAVWRIEFRERERPTIVHTPEGRSVVSTGRIWVDPSNGRVLQTEQRNTVEALHVTITVWFQEHEELGLLVPTRMTETYDAGVDRLETEATYDDYRRFTATARIR